MPLGHSKPGAFPLSALPVTLLLAVVLVVLPWFLGLPTPAWVASSWHGLVEPSRPVLGDLDGEAVAFVAITARASAMEIEQDLLLWDMHAATTVNLTPDTSDADPVAGGRSPSLYGDRVAYSDTEGTVFLLDLETSVRTTVATAETDTRALGPQLQGGKVVWLALRADDLTYAEGSYLVIHDLVSDAEVRIGDSGAKVSAGWVFDGDHILYISGDGGPDGLLLYTLSTATTLLVPGSEDVAHVETGGGRLGYDLGGDYVVWRTPDGADLNLYRISTGQSVKIPRQGEWIAGGPATDGESVVYPGLVTVDDWTAQKLYAYDIEDHSTTLIEVNVLGDIQALCVDGEAFAYDVSAGMNSPFLYGGFFPVFVDVPVGNPYYDAINTLGGQGIIVGYETSQGREFRPNNPIWRAQFAKMIDETLGLDVTEDMTTPFVDLGDDVLDNLFPHEYVAAAYDNGITTGITPTTFGPFLDIARAQVVTMVVRAAQSLRPPGFLSLPAESYHSAWGTFSPDHQGSADIAEYNGLTGGLDLAALDPWGKMTRGEAAQILMNLQNHQPAH